MRLHVLGFLVAGLALASAPASAQVHVAIAEGRVTVSAKDATIRQILTEWARVGQTRIVNLDRLSGTPMSLELTNVPEAQALETVLRSVSGYLAAPRATELPNASRYDRIFLLASSSGSAARPAPAAPASPPAPAFAPPAFSEDTQVVDEEAQRPPAPPPGQNLPIRGPAFATFPQPQAPQQQQQQQGGAPSFAAPPFGSAPSGVSTPGMVVPAPQPVAPRNTDR